VHAPSDACKHCTGVASATDPHVGAPHDPRTLRSGCAGRKGGKMVWGLMLTYCRVSAVFLAVVGVREASGSAACCDHGCCTPADARLS
jgi:hypothetical protein